MKILVTAGNAQAPIDRVRCVTNVFTGRTGAAIAVEAWRRGHDVTLVTSQPDLPRDLAPPAPFPDRRWATRIFRTYDDLREILQAQVPAADAVIHAAAVNDYASAGIYASAPGTSFDADTATWRADAGPPTLADRGAGKVKSDEPELWLRLTRTVKLVDCFREPWGFRGFLAKFKLEVGVSEAELEAIAERSRLASAADLMVANTLEGAAEWALVGPTDGRYVRISRAAMAACVLDRAEGK